MLLLLIAAALLLVTAAISKAAVDVLTHQPDNNVFIKLGAWYDARTSWKLKYRDYDAGDLRPAFPASTTLLVAYTDFWHMADMVYLVTYALSGMLQGFVIGTKHGLSTASLWLMIAYFSTSKVLFGAVFELFYTRIFRARK